MNKQNQHTLSNNLPKGWEVLPFDKVFEFVSSYAVSRGNLTEEKTSGCVQNIHYGDIHAKFTNEILDLKVVEELPFIKDEALNGNSFSFVKDGDLIIADVSEDYEGIGECVELINVGKKKVVGGLHTFVARAINGKTANGFRCYILRSPAVRLNLKKLATGSNVYGVSKTNLSKLKLLLPPLPEQRKIATILSTCDKAIETTQNLIKSKERLKNGLMQQLFTGSIRIKEFFKQKWVEVEIGSISKIRRGASPRPIGDPKYFSDKGRGWIRIADLTAEEGMYITKASQYLSNLGELHSVKVNDGDLIMSICATIGLPKIVKFPACIHDGFVLFADFENKLDKFYLYHFISFITAKIARSGQPGTQKNLNTDIVSKIKIPLPSLPEQRNIASILSSCDEEIQILKLQQQMLRKEKKGLMKVLLTGEVRVKTTK